MLNDLLTQKHYAIPNHNLLQMWLVGIKLNSQSYNSYNYRIIKFKLLIDDMLASVICTYSSQVVLTDV